jgi:hypothetical protein
VDVQSGTKSSMCPAKVRHLNDLESQERFL